MEPLNGDIDLSEEEDINTLENHQYLIIMNSVERFFYKMKEMKQIDEIAKVRE